eukprot:COSAG04_NODE_1693_length_5912_cov_5.083606_5_plen_117_part_00
MGGRQLADQVQYSLGSKWAPVATGQQTFSATSDTAAEGAAAGTPLASAPFAPPQVKARSPARYVEWQSLRPDCTTKFNPLPQAPEVFTVFLLGDKGYGYTLLPQLDAPETGPCKPP